MSLVQLPEWQALLQEISISLKALSHRSPTFLVVPLLVESEYFTDDNIVGWDTRKTVVKLLHDGGPLETEMSATFYMNLFKIMTVDNPQAPSILKDMPRIFRQSVQARFQVVGHRDINLQHLYDALQSEDGLHILGHLELSRDLLQFFERYVKSLTERLVEDEFWMDYVHRPDNLFLICRHAIRTRKDDLLLSFARINPTAEGWHQCMRDLIPVIQNEDLLGYWLEIGSENRRRVWVAPPPRLHVLDVIAELKSILKLTSPEFDIPRQNMPRLDDFKICVYVPLSDHYSEEQDPLNPAEVRDPRGSTDDSVCHTWLLQRLL